MTVADIMEILGRYSQTSEVVFFGHDGTKLIFNGEVMDDLTEKTASTGADSPATLLLDLRRLR
jgi:hypothetical protein